MRLLSIFKCQSMIFHEIIGEKALYIIN